MADELQTIVIDTGSFMCKAGFAGELAPRALFPTIVGRLRRQTKAGILETYVGGESLTKPNIALALKNPLERGVVTDWDSMEKLWRHTFFEALRRSPDEHPVLLTESALAPKENREKTAQIMFETFKTPNICFATNAV